MYDANRPAILKWNLMGLGYSTVNLRTLYKAVFCPIISYGAPGWAPYINQSDKKKLLATQHSVLIRITKAYATTSTAALPVLASVLPIDLLLEQLTAHFRFRYQKNFLVGEVEFCHED